jgi:aspartate kinase
VIVLKFGGTSVGDAAAIERAADIVRGRVSKKPVVVVSAMSGVTNSLIAIGEQAAKGHLIGALRGVEGLRERHLDEAGKLIKDAAVRSEISSELSALLDELASLAEALATLGHATPRSQDAVAAMGEQLSSLMIVAAFRERGIDAELLDAREVVITNDNFGKAEPLPDDIAAAARERVLPMLKARKVPVMGGFIGGTGDSRITTTLGRGGSDYSAALVGAALRSDAIEIWTDVDGMLTADPRVVEKSQLIDHVSFDEAAELASFGAKVLHPSTIAPAVKLGIPVFVLNSRRPEGTGTRITFDAPRRPVTAIAGKTGVTVVRVRSSRMLMAHGFLQTIFDLFARHRVSVDVVSTSEVSVSVTVDDASRLDALLVDLRRLGDVAVERKRGVIALVGLGIADDCAAMARALTALGTCKVHMVSLSATGLNLTIVIDEEGVPDAMKRLHTAFFEGGPDE